MNRSMLKQIEKNLLKCSFYSLLKIFIIVLPRERFARVLHLQHLIMYYKSTCLCVSISSRKSRYFRIKKQSFSFSEISTLREEVSPFSNKIAFIFHFLQVPYKIPLFFLTLSDSLFGSHTSVGRPKISSCRGC